MISRYSHATRSIAPSEWAAQSAAQLLSYATPLVLYIIRVDMQRFGLHMYVAYKPHLINSHKILEYFCSEKLWYRNNTFCWQRSYKTRQCIVLNFHCSLYHVLLMYRVATLYTYAGSRHSVPSVSSSVFRRGPGVSALISVGNCDLVQ